MWKVVMLRTMALCAMALFLMTTGCAQVMCLGHPGPKNPVIAAGESKTKVTADLGQPVSTDATDTHCTVIYKYQDGGEANNGGWKTLRVVGYTVGDIFTCWLDQIIWMPMEALAFAPDNHTVTATFVKDADGNWVVENVDNHKEKSK